MKTSKADIVRDLGEYRERRSWLNFRCPYHHGDGLHFGVNVHTGVFSCFVCGETGTMDRLYRDLRDGKARRVGVQGRLIQGLPPLKWTGSTSGLTVVKATTPDDRVPVSPDLQRELNAFKSGYIDLGTALATHPSVSAVNAMAYAIYRRFPVELLDVGLHNDMAGRLVFPFYEQGEIVYWTTRSFAKQPLKTTNPDVELGWRGKTDVLWQIDRCNPAREVFIVEGVFDCGAVWRVGKQAVPLLGKTISKKQIALLKSRGVTRVNVLLDQDADREAALLAIRLFREGFEVGVCQWEIGLKDEDPASIDDRALLSMLHLTLKVSHRVALQLSIESR